MKRYSGIFNKRTLSENADLVQRGKIFYYNNISFAEWLPEIYRVLKRGTHFYCMSSGRHLREFWDAAEQAGFKYVNTIV